MKITTIILGLVIGALIGAALGFGIPFGIAQLNPGDAPALSFFPIVTMPVGAVIGAIVGVVLAIRKNRQSEGSNTEA